MSRTLFLFVTSESPDPYLNSMSYCFFMQDVRKVVFVHIAGLTEGGIGHGDLVDHHISRRISRNTRSQLEALARGEYRTFRGDNRSDVTQLGSLITEAKLGALMAHFKQIQDSNLVWDNRDINYESLQEQVSRMRKEDPRAIFDVTALRKAYLADLIAVSIVVEIDALATFDLLRRMDHDLPWRNLVHELERRDQYRYVNLLSTPAVRQAASSVLLKRRVHLGLALLTVVLVLGTTILVALAGVSHPVVRTLTVAGSIASLASLLTGFLSQSSWRNVK